MRGNVLILTICYTLFQIFFGLTTSYLSLYILALGGSTFSIGFVNALGGMASLVLSPIGGYIADISGRIKLIGYATYAYSFTYIFFAFASNWKTIAIGKFLNQLILLLYFPAMNALMADSLPPRKRGIGYATTNAIRGAFYIGTSFLGGYFIGRFGVIPSQRYCYIFGIGVSLVAATLRLKLLKETLQVNDIVKPLKRNLGIFTSSFKSVLETLKWMPKNLLSIAVVMAVNFFFASTAGPFWIVYATKVIGITPTQWGLIMLISGALRIVLTIPIGSLVDKYGRRRLILSGIAVSVLPVFLFVHCTTFIQVLLVSITVSIASLLATPAFSSIIADIVPKEKRGRIMSALGQGGFMVMGQGSGTSFIASTTIVFGSFLGGFIYELNKMCLWYVFSTALFFSLILSIKSIYEPAKAEI